MYVLYVLEYSYVGRPMVIKYWAGGTQNVERILSTFDYKTGDPATLLDTVNGWLAQLKN